jgi:diaminohydroxyphosphoribosylaminopyrimidine deaminase/5-amino-6-(5-phosphoribosylamino)uracil reductase
MREALQEAALGFGLTTPNPAVGCVLVKDGREVARGHYRGAGGPHAEAVALQAAGRRAKGATAYVTLEPHAHQGRTPPCTDALIAAGVARVVIGCIDPNAAVAGRGVRQLRAAGLDLVCGVREADCVEIIRGYRRFVAGEGPLVHLKMASTLDGRIATATGDSRWISGPDSRALVQRMRRRAEAVLVGIGTVLADDPRLTCRLPGAPQPLRVVLDPELRTPPAAKVVRGRGRVLVIGSKSAAAARRRRLEAAGAEVECFDSRGTRGWRRVLDALARRGVMEVLVEGGASVAASAIRAGVVGRVSIFYNPRLLGGDGIPMVGPLGVKKAADGPRLAMLALSPVGDDLLWEGEFA